MGFPTISQEGIPIVPLMGALWEKPHMQDVAEILPLRVKERIEALGKTKRGVSLAIKAHAGYVRDLLDPDRFNVPSATRLEKLAEELETTTDYLLGKADAADMVRSEVSVLADRQLGFRGPPPQEPGIPLVGTGDCADLEVIDDSGRQIAVERSSFDPEYHVRYIERPPALSGDHSAYAIFYHGSSMEPRFYAGEVGIAQPSRPAAPGDFVVVQMTNGEGPDVITVLVKQLVRQTASYVELRQFNPDLTFRLERRMVARMHRLVPPTEMLLR